MQPAANLDRGLPIERAEPPFSGDISCDPYPKDGSLQPIRGFRRKLDRECDRDPRLPIKRAELSFSHTKTE